MKISDLEHLEFAGKKDKLKGGTSANSSSTAWAFTSGTFGIALTQTFTFSGSGSYQSPTINYR